MKTKNNEKIYPHPYFPVGSIYLSVVNTNPSIWFGGTWELISQGRTLVGVDINDTDFNTAKKIGGEKKHILTVDEMPEHNHIVFGNTNPGDNSGVGYWNFITREGYCYGNDVNLYFNGSSTRKNGNSQAHNNMPPYFTCYIWCRTA